MHLTLARALERLDRSAAERAHRRFEADDPSVGLEAAAPAMRALGYEDAAAGPTLLPAPGNARPRIGEDAREAFATAAALARVRLMGTALVPDAGDRGPLRRGRRADRLRRAVPGYAEIQRIALDPNRERPSLATAVTNANASATGRPNMPTAAGSLDARGRRFRTRARRHEPPLARDTEVARRRWSLNGD
jgi:hypothetical protein